MLGQLNFTDPWLRHQPEPDERSCGRFCRCTRYCSVLVFQRSRPAFNNAAGLPNGADANVVLGQLNFTNHGSATTESPLKSPLRRDSG